MGASHPQGLWTAAARLHVRVMHDDATVRAHPAVPRISPASLHGDMPGARYLGLDVVRPIVANATDRFADEPQWTFAVHDFITGPPPQADLLFCRDALQHLPVLEVRAGTHWLKIHRSIKRPL